MPSWLSICALLLNCGVAYAAAVEESQRPSRVMRTQRHGAGVLEISGAGNAQFSLAEGGFSSSSAKSIISDAEERDDSSEDADFLAPNTTGLQCSDMPSGFCCGLSPKKIRVEAGGEKCACGGPKEGGRFSSQAAIDQYCSEVAQPCDQLSHVTCCDSVPKRIRHHDGKGQCWCSSPQNESSHNTQESIDEWCSSVIRPCTSLSEGHCCHMHPKQIRQGSGDKCWCSGPQKGGRFQTQELIDAACKEVVKPCPLVPRARCCTMSPKQIRYNDGNNQCWCSGPVVGEAFSSQIAVDEWCQKVLPTTTTTTVQTTTTTSTPWLSNLTCEEVSEAECCAMAPKRWRATQKDDRCYCADAVPGSNFSSQQAIDAHCALVVRPCQQMRQEDCCTMSPSKYLVGDDRGEQAGVGEGSTKMCTCTGPLKDGRFTEQKAIDGACARLWSPCSPIQKAQCCLSEPARMREGRGKRCFCAGPSPVGAYKSQKEIDEECNKIVQSCDDLSASDCCSQMPAQVRVSDGYERCWCSAPFSYGNISYSQQQIDFVCSSAQPPTVDLN